MIWWKTWRESRARFLIAAVIIAAVVAWAILDCDQAMRRFDRKPPITFEQYVWHVYAGRFQMLWSAAAMFLGLGGLLRERSAGTAGFTLSLPVSRGAWMAVRAWIGAAQATVLALLPAAVIPVTAAIVGRSYPVWEALKFSTLLCVAGMLFFCLGLLYSSLLPGEFTSALAGLVSLYLIFTAYDYLWMWFPHFRMASVLSGADYVDRATGFLASWPWSDVLKCVSVAAVMYVAAVQAIARRDF